MWSDQIRGRFWWAKIQSQLDKLLYELSKAEDEEELELYVLELHQRNEEDLKYFSTEERKKIEELLTVLIRGSRKHKELLGRIVKELEEVRAQHAR